MFKQVTVSGLTTDLRSDHLKAVLQYAIEQAKTSNIAVLDCGANEQALDLDEQLEYMQTALQLIEGLTADGNKDLLIVSADDDQLFKYHSQE